MAVKILLGFGFLITCCLMEVSSRPNNESTKVELPLDESQDLNDKVERSITFTQDTSTSSYSGNMRDIIEKIQAVNDGLKKPHKQQTQTYKAPPLPESYVIDKELLEKIQQIIASGKFKPSSEMNKQHENNFINEDLDENRKEHSKALPMLSSEINQQSMPFTPFPYIMNVPIVVMPYGNNNHKYPNYESNFIQSAENFQTRQEQPSPFPSFPSFGSNFQWPFQIQWPFANFFPLIIKDPFIALQQGGGWNNFFENGQTADVCSRKQKSINSEMSNNEDEIKSILRAIETIKDSVPNDNNHDEEDDETIDPVLDMNIRQNRALKKRTVSSSAPGQEIESERKTQNIYVAKPVVTRKPPKKIYIEAEVPEDTKTNAADGDLRFPFGGFDWFGNKKPVAPSPGFFINRLRVRKGGVAIAGPGGVATAGRGGTAIVGPGGLAYTQPGGLAVAGPAARVIALSSETDLNSVVTRLRQLNDTSLPLKQPIREGKVVATGPVIYYHPNEQTASVQYLPFYGGAKGQYLEIKKDNRGTVLSEKIVAEDSISSENVIKNSNDNLLSRVLAANLQNLKTLSTNLIRLHNLGRKVGSLSASDKTRFKSQLSALAEAASNTIKLVEEVGDDVFVLFRSNATLRRYDDADEDYVGEEGIGIDNPEEPGDSLNIRGTIAEAKPVGLAVIGENGLAASRPVATAVAQSGVAIARPIATAIAGLDPTALGIEYHHNQYSKRARV